MEDAGRRTSLCRAARPPAALRAVCLVRAMNEQRDHVMVELALRLGCRSHVTLGLYRRVAGSIFFIACHHHPPPPNLSLTHRHAGWGVVTMTGSANRPPPDLFPLCCLDFGHGDVRYAGAAMLLAA